MTQKFSGRISLVIPRNFLVIVFTLISALTSFSQQFTISGTITDQSNGETVIGAKITVTDIPGTGTITNTYGFYSISLPGGKHELRFSYYGLKDSIIQLDLHENKTINIALWEEVKELQEIVVNAQKSNSNITDTKIGVEHLNPKDIKKIPVLLGEQDVLKTLQLTPGIKSVGEGSGGLYVRGGDNSQNLILLDEATVYNANHLFGFFSTFNSDAVKELNMYKGTAPANYGGRLSSVVDVTMNDGNNQKFHVGGGIGLIASRLALEGPIVKNKGSFLISGRRTYADVFLPLAPDKNVRGSKLYFYDLNLKANYKLNDNNKLYVSGYFGRDYLGFSNLFGLDWGNATGTIRLNHKWSNKLFSNTSLIYSDFHYKVRVTQDQSEFSITSKIKNTNFKQDFSYYANNKNTLHFGWQSTYYFLTPGQVENTGTFSIPAVKLQQRYAWDNALYISHNYKPSNRWNLEYGIRLTLFQQLGSGDFYSYDTNGDVSDTTHFGAGKTVKAYFNPEPRINAAYILNESTSLKFSYTRNIQNLHLITKATSSTPTDLWVSSSNNIKPEIADQLSAGYFKNLKNDQYQFSAEVYYKWIQNSIDLRNGANIYANELLEGELLYGKGKAYGIEFMLRKKTGKFTGWIGYTYSRVQNKINGIDNGNWYSAKQDIPNSISVVGIYDLNKKWSFSASWVYSTGYAVTFPSGKYILDGSVQYYYSERNGYRMPDYHRLDLGATWNIKKTQKFESSLTFSIYNAYGRKNAYSIEFQQDEDDPEKTKVIMTYLFTYVPSITYNFKF